VTVGWSTRCGPKEEAKIGQDQEKTKLLIHKSTKSNRIGLREKKPEGGSPTTRTRRGLGEKAASKKRGEGKKIM